MMKLYSILKSSYRDEHEPFMLNLLFGQVSNIDNLKLMLKKIVCADDVNRFFISQRKNDENLFYVEYTQDFEEDFYHGFSIQVFDVNDNRQYKITSSETEYDDIINFLKSLEK